jgi:ABC-type Fe3+-siderophore transport system permease subunit
MVMKKSDLSCIICSVFIAMTAFFYAFAMWFGIKLPRYYPVEHTWKWIKEKGVTSQGWYAHQVFAFLAAGVVSLVLYFILKPRIDQTNLKSSSIKMIGMGVTLIVIICMAYMLYHEFNKWGVFASLGL